MKTPKNIRVLYAEDNDDACVMVSMLLGFANIDVTAAQNRRRSVAIGAG